VFSSKSSLLDVFSAFLPYLHWSGIAQSTANLHIIFYRVEPTILDFGNFAPYFGREIPNFFLSRLGTLQFILSLTLRQYVIHRLVGAATFPFLLVSWYVVPILAYFVTTIY
jgi:hypothetical protein